MKGARRTEDVQEPRGREPRGDLGDAALLLVGEEHHAAAALVYCDAFFTERSLATMITQRHVALDLFYDCFVTDDPDQAVSWTSAHVSA